MDEDAAPLPWFSRAPHSLSVLPADAIARAAAARVVAALGSALERRGKAVLAPSAGRTPLATYALLRAAHRSSLDWSRVVCVQIDEYEGVGDCDPRGFAAELRRELVEPLGIGRLLRFHDAAGELRRPLESYERAVRGLGGIDCAVHGVGRNGHVAFNEPGDERARATRRVRLARSTRVANGVLFTSGVTLGLDVLAEAREALVLMIGDAKRDAAESVLFRAGGRENPAAAIRRCGRVTVLLDPEAAPERLLALTEPAEAAGRPAPVLASPPSPRLGETPPAPAATAGRTPDLIEQGP
jgi:glucosamine-6-phosphate deaminase